MQSSFVTLLVLGIVVLLLVMLLTSWVAGAKKPGERKFIAGIAMLMIILGGICLSISWYNAGQLNKKLPSLKGHHCTQVTRVEYRLGESYRKPVNQLAKASHDSHCTGSIIVNYPEKQEKTIPLK